MSRDQRKNYYKPRENYRNRPMNCKRSPRQDKVRSRSPKHERDIDDNILQEISKLPEPNDLWDSHFQNSFEEPPPPPSFTQENSDISSTYQYPGIYDDFPSVVPQPPQPPDIAWHQLQPAVPPPAPTFHNNVEDQLKKEAAIESEVRHQKATLSKQREDYLKKTSVLKKELDNLKEQRNELRGSSKRSPSPDTKRFLKENTKLQLEIQNKLKTINNVVDMLNDIIGEEAQDVPVTDDVPERSKRKSRSPSASNTSKFNYVYYDPEMHWCRICNEIPATAKDYLNHLHTQGHHKMAAAHQEAPWHSLPTANEGFPSIPNAPTKRMPIRGLQFIVPSTAWYCKLCDQFIGDLHCASAHLKSVNHYKNYSNFAEQNPHWETDWMSDRQKAIEKTRLTKLKEEEEEKSQYMAHTITFSKDGFHTKQKKSPSPSVREEKKKKKVPKKIRKRRSTSSSSSDSEQSSSSESDHEKKKLKKRKRSKLKSDVDDKTLIEWMDSIRAENLNNNDRKLLQSLKARVNKGRDGEKSPITPPRAEPSSQRNINVQNFRRDLNDRRSNMNNRRPNMNNRRVNENERRGSQGDQRSEIDDRKGDPNGRRGDTNDRKGDTNDRRGNTNDRRGDTNDRRGDTNDRRDKPNDQRGEPDNSKYVSEKKKQEAREVDDKPGKKFEQKKMPFIGKMPVFKSMGRIMKTEEQKKEEEKKKQEDEQTKIIQKKREEIDVEIKKKVAEFRQKIKQKKKGAGLMVPPNTFDLPPNLKQKPPTLPKDFQDALDIIFPSGPPPNLEGSSDQFSNMPPPMLQAGVPHSNPGFISTPPVMNIPPPQFGPMNVMPPPHMPPQMNPQWGFDLSCPPPIFPRPQLYDNNVPMMPPNNEPRPQVRPTNPPPNKQNKGGQINENTVKRNEELEDMAMLGIDASDVGAGN